MKGRVGEDINLAVFIVVLQISTVWSASHKHLGCWMDTTADPDLSGQSKTLSSVTLTACVTYCNEAGYAYAGFKQGAVCSCGNKYGRHGVSNTCNYTCEQGSVLCGGVIANDIYYAIDSDIVVRARRDFEAYSNPMSFFEARKRCVIANGDLVTLRDPSYFTKLQTAATAGGISSEFIWVGLFWNSNNKYIWSDPSIVGLTNALSSPYWRASETHSRECVRMSVSGKDWSTASCASQYPFICSQLPPVPAATTSPDGTEYSEQTESKGFFQDRKKITFYLVLPLFVLCYGGSCLLYALSRCWRYVKKRRKQQARDAMVAASMQEYEPDTKPLTESESRPLTSRDVKVDEGHTPPPPYYRVNSRASRADRPIQTPIKKFRPDEEEEVKPRPQSRAVSRRSELLDNAYSEAKERRRREGHTPEPQSRPRTSRTPRPPLMEEPGPMPPMSSQPPPRAGAYQVSSLDPNEPEIDYTKLSINDIMYIRGLMSNNEDKNKRKKPKKIIVA